MKKRFAVSYIEIFLFILSIVFAPQYLPIDIRPLVYIFWGLLGIKRTGWILRKSFYTSITTFILYFLTIYSLSVIFINGTGEYSLGIRYFRALLSVSAITLYLNSYKISSDRIIKGLIGVLLIHSLVIIIEIIEPSSRAYFYIFAETNQIEYPFRANGLVNGYDYAGLYTNIGLMLVALKYIKDRSNSYLIAMIIFIIATIFTSRLNMLLMLVTLIIIFRQSLIFKAKVLATGLLIFFLTTGSIGIFLLAITTDAFPEIRKYIFNNVEGTQGMYEVIRLSYSDDNVENVIEEQFKLISAKNMVFGSGEDGNIDPGYNQLINTIGIIGTGIILLYYCSMIFYLKSKKGIKKRLNNLKIVYLISIYLLLFNIIFNFKLLFFFSAGIFEMTSILIICYERNKKINET
ncbi:hypothetical protein LB456_04580 [Psychroflexus sp. CAK57W]|uniref:hypothetical protein n=1 Tax=Psychroflexus curvus TaxID=2873595 RepID=UPI001CCCB4C6|nr:hypothetical protein [Psychroflexus curvus]MBZ9786726.1 hypothetical protein [Psychroflexus curvus]